MSFLQVKNVFSVWIIKDFFHSPKLGATNAFHLCYTSVERRRCFHERNWHQPDRLGLYRHSLWTANVRRYRHCLHLGVRCVHSCRRWFSEREQADSESLEAEMRNRQSKHSGGNPTVRRIPAWIPRRPRKRTKQYPQSQFPESEESDFYFSSGKTLTAHSDSSP